MKKTLFTLLFLTAAACFAALPQVDPQKAWRPVKAASAQKSVSAMPKFLNKNTIVCGNKQLLLSADGKISIANTSGEIVSINLQYVFQDVSTGSVDWITTTAALCKIRQQGNKVLWELWKKHKLHTWKIADQSIEILSDGRIKLSAQVCNPQSSALKPRNPLAAFFVYFPVAGNEGKKMKFNDTEYTLNADTKGIGLWNGKRFDYDLFYDNPAETVIFRSVDINRTGKLVTAKKHRIDFTFNREGNGSIIIDLRKSSDVKSDPVNIGAGVDFKSIENLELPWRGKRNLLANSGFEQGFHSWKSHSGYWGAYWEGKWNFVPFEISNDAYHGSNALLMRGRDIKLHDFRNLRGGINLTGGAMFLTPGKYTVSFYAKTVKGKAKLSAWIHNFHSLSYATHYLPPHESGSMTVEPTNQWKRYSKTIIIEKAMPTALSINVAGDSLVLVDAVQFEKGTAATAYEFPPAAGTLLTSEADNFISAGKKVNARVKIFTKPSTNGKVSVRVKNFFGEIVKTSKHNFKSDAKGHAVVALPFENLGKGIFMVRFDYQLADGTKSFDHCRFTVADFLNNTHRLKNMFSDDYGAIENHYNFIKILERWRKTGIGAKTHVVSRAPMFSNKYREYGVEPTNASIATMLWAPNTTRVTGFGIAPHIPEGLKYTTSPGFLIKDHNVSNNGEVDDAYFKKVEEASAQVAAANKHIKCWTMYAEIRAKFPNDWWSKEGTDEKATDIHIRYLKAVVDGVRRGNPEAKIFQDAPCNMRPDGGIAETAKLLANCNKYGIKFDIIAIHPYRFSPESPDLDSDAQTFFKAIKKCGYGDDVKVMWPELMHWGPLNIPQWGTVASTWGRVPATWPGWTVSYDIAETEKRTAAWRARTWLVALKYSDRIITATSGSNLNNFSFDENMTPYASQMVSNTLGNILGDSHFKKDIRFAPLVRAYVFEDAEKRPVAAVWCHMENVDNGYTDAPVAEADFGSSLESVIDLMNNKRAFTKGKFRFPVTSYPLFLRGKKGTLNEMVKALEKAVIISGEGISPVEASAVPVDNKNVQVKLKNFLTTDFKGVYNGKNISIPGSGELLIKSALPSKILRSKVTKEQVAATLKSSKGQTYNYDLAFEAFAAGKVADDVTFKNIDWNKLPAVKFTRNCKKRETSGNYRVAWNKFGLFIQVEVKDGKFIHNEYKNTASRWSNDCLQIYIDTMANARTRQFKGYDEDDYDYAVFPNSKGDSSIVWRNRSVEQQLGLATAAPSDMTVAHDIPSSFSNVNGVLTYRVFFPAKYLLPAKMQSGWAIGLGLYAANSDVPNKVSSALTNATDGGECYNRPHAYPVLLLEK